MGPVSGDSIIYTTTTGNTGDVTLNVDSKGAAHIRKWSGSSVLASGDLVANVPVQLIFDGTYWELQTIGNAPSGTGNVNAGSSLFTGGPVVSSNNTTGVAASSAYLDCSQFSGADWTLQVKACLSALNTLNSTAGVADARGIAAGGTTGSVNPFGGTHPISGQLLKGPGIYLTNVPIIMPSTWSIVGEQGGIGGTTGTTIQAGASFQTTYTTGTITVGSPGASEVITGSGTAWTSSMIGCAFYGANGGANSTFGVITAVGSGTSLTLGWGQNVGTGAAGASSYSIACPVITRGSGGASANGAQYGMRLENLNIDCNNVAGSIGILDWYGNQGTTDKHVRIGNCPNIGHDVEFNFQQSGPFDDEVVSAGSTCTASTLLVAVRSIVGSQAFRGFTGLSLSKGACPTSPTVGVDVENGGSQFINPDLAGVVTGISIGANTTCPVSCVAPGHLSSGTLVDGAYLESSITTGVLISNANGTSNSTILRNFTNSATNNVIDQVNLCTDTGSKLGIYQISVAGTIAYSTSSTSGCGSFNVTNYSSNHTLNAGDVQANVSGTTTITVPHAFTGKSWFVFALNGSTVTLTPDSGNISGNATAPAASLTVAPNTGFIVTCDGTNCFATGGGGSSGIGGSATVGYEPVMVTNTTTITTSPCDHGVTTANTMTCTDSAGAKFGTTVTTTSDGVHPGASSYPGNTTLPSLPANTVSIVGPPSATPTAWSLQLPTALPTNNYILSCVVTGTNCLITPVAAGSAAFPLTVTGGISGAVPCFTSTTVEAAGTLLATNALAVGGGSGACPSTGNGDFTYAAHTLTGGASGLVDFSAITSSSGFKVPIHSSNTAGAAGVVDYDSSAGSTHMFTGGADSISAGFASAPTTGQVVVTSGTAGVIAGSTTPNIGAATGTSLIASGVVDGKAIVNVTTGATLTFGTTGTACSSCYYDNEEATAGTAITGTLPTASAGLQYCIDNAYNGSAANTGTLEILTSAAGQYIIYTDGTLSASGGYVISGGAARDSACVRGVDSTHWMLYVYSGTWSKH
ncbi:MAG: hypothetical protein WCC95_18595 [Candidatus Sulfotelmatobacter sp.]